MKPTIDALLDGLLDDAQTIALTREAGGTIVRTTMEVQQQIDLALERLFTPPSANRFLEKSFGALNGMKLGPRESVRISMRRRLALAAAVGLCILGTWRLSSIFRPNPINKAYQAQPWRSMDTVYRDSISAGFKPDWVCKNEDEFASFFRRSTGSRLLLAEASPDVHAYGLSTCNCITPNTLYLLARVENSEVLVFADRAARDPGGWKPTTPGVNLFQRQVGGAVLYEFTQLDSPHLLDLFHLDDGSTARPLDGEPSRWQKDAAEGAKPKP